jgi:hypothetical protein
MARLEMREKNPRRALSDVRTETQDRIRSNSRVLNGNRLWDQGCKFHALHFQSVDLQGIF